MNVKQQAIQRAINFLNAASAKYKIIDEAGEVVADTLPVAAPEAPKKMRNVVNNFARDTGYVKTLHGMEPGSIATFPRSMHPCLADNHSWQSFIASVMSVAAKHFGARDKMLVERSPEMLTIMRAE